MEWHVGGIKGNYKEVVVTESTFIYVVPVLNVSNI